MERSALRADDRFYDAGAVKHLGDDQILVPGVLVIAAAANDDGGDAVAAEDVPISAAANRMGVGLHTEVTEDAKEQVGGGVAGLELVAGVAEVEAAVQLRIGVALLDLGEMIFRTGDEGFDLFEFHGPHLALDDAGFGDGVADEPAADGAHVPCRFKVHSTLRQAEHGFCGDSDGRNAFFGLDTSMGGAAIHFDRVGVVVGRLALDGGRWPTAVDDDGDLRGDAAVVHILRAHEPDLLAATDGDFDRPRPGPIFDGRLDDFEDDRAASLVVGAEDGGPISANDVVAVPDGFDAAAGLHRVHVGREKDGLAGTGARGEDVSVGILGAFEAKGLQTEYEFRRDGVFVTGRRIDGDKFEKASDETVADNHWELRARDEREEYRDEAPLGPLTGASSQTPTMERVTTETAIQRHLHFEYTFNIRHLGGYRTRDGRETRAEVIRAASLHRLTDAGVEEFVSHGITTVVDLRSERERVDTQAPDMAGHGVRHVFAPVFSDDASPAGLSEGFTGFGPIYREFLETGQPAYRALFGSIAASEGRVVFHCAAGKDRTGVAAALLLELAGVEDEDIVADYSQSAELLKNAFADLRAREAQTRPANVDEATMQKLLGSEPEYIEDTLSYIRGRWGSARGYMHAIGLTPAETSALRAKLVS